MMLRLLGELIVLWRWLNKNPADRAEQARRFFQMEGMGDSVQDAPGGMRRVPKAREYSFEHPDSDFSVTPEKSSGFSAYAWYALLLAFMMSALSDDAETGSAGDDAEDGQNAGFAELAKDLVELVCDPSADEAFAHAAALHGSARSAESVQNAKSARIDFAEYKTLQFLAVYLTIRRIYGDKDVWRRIVREVAKEVDRAYAGRGVRNTGESVEARMDVYAPFAEAVQAAKRADELTDILANSISRAMVAFGSSPAPSPEEIDPGMRLVLLEAFIDAFRGALAAHRVSLGLSKP